MCGRNVGYIYHKHLMITRPWAVMGERLGIRYMASRRTHYSREMLRKRYTA